VSTALLLACTLSAPAIAADWSLDHPRPGITVLRDDTGAWGGFSMGVAHIRDETYQVRKTLDLNALPEGALRRAKAARLRFYFAIQDYSWNMGDKTPNGLNEAFEVVVNGNALRFETKDPRFPSKANRTDPLRADWADVDVPLAWLKPGETTVLLRKLPGGKGDDYVYPGIDNSVQHGQSATSFDGGKTWREDKLNTIDAQGEFMVRLVLSEVDLHATATWELPDRIDDPAGWIAYHGIEGEALRLEPQSDGSGRSDRFDGLRPLRAVAWFEGTAPTLAWLDLDEKPIPTGSLKANGNTVASELPPGQWSLGALQVTPAEGGRVRKITLDFELPTTEPKPVVDLRPDISPPKGKRRNVAPSCRIDSDTATLDNGALRAVFQLRPTLALRSLHVGEIDRNVLARPEATHLFRLKVGDAVYGCHEAKVVAITPVTNGFEAKMDIGDTRLLGTFTARAELDELRLGFTVTHAPRPAARPPLTTDHSPLTLVQFHLAFPHLAGLKLSGNPADDYYLFPWGGGVLANVPTTLRTSYGEETAWWQMIDLFSPARGGGLYLRSDDPTGLYKCPSLRKGESVHGDYALDETGRGFLEPDMLWRNALEPAPGIGVAFDYLRRERAPGTSFRAPDACLGSHAGDWREAMKRYATWSHQTWPPRPYPSKLTNCWHIVAPGWGQGPLFKDGAYRTDYLLPANDVVEMMSWWTWSDKGPWGVPMDRLKEELGEALYRRYEAYWVKEPVSGKLMYPLNRGDYDGYMPEWGGLPALRAHIEDCRKAGNLPMFYTDPILADANTKLGSQHGLEYGIMNPLWKDDYKTGKTPAGYVGSYGGYCMCLDTEWYSGWVADTLARVCRETGIDGVRVDEYGHRGYVCTSDKHKHLFAEPGHNAWLQALSRNCRQIHAAMDKVRPGLLLTAEFPGNDDMAAALEGAIVYDVRRESPVRPAPINLFRFYFPECKSFEIDRPHRRNASAMMLWNAVGAFSARYPDDVHALLKEHTGVFERTDNEPLVPTLVPRVYANRFGAADEVIYTVYNATGHTVDAPVLPVEDGGKWRCANLLTHQELAPVTVDGQGAIRLKMKREETVVIGRLRQAAGNARPTGVR